MDNLQPQVEFIQELVENLTVNQLHPEPPEDLIQNLSKMKDRLTEVKETVSDLTGQIEAHTERVSQFQVTEQCLNLICFGIIYIVYFSLLMFETTILRIFVVLLFNLMIILGCFFP